MKKRIAATLALALTPGWVRAGPPFLTDDPVPVELRQGEFYLFSTYDESRSGKEISLPSVEYNYGALPDTQLHVAVPYQWNAPHDGPDARGLGDVEIGAKYRFVHESDRMPQVAVFPAAILPTGNSERGLGNGRTWWRLPVWAQKSWGAWTTYGGGGYVINHADGQRSYAFGGWLLQKDIGDRWTLGGEVFAREKDTTQGEASTVLNFGGTYRFTPQFNLLVSVGHSTRGEAHTLAYAGLWWALGD